MVDEKYVELMHHEIDGVITADDRERLQQYLAENSEAASFYDELRSVSNLLAQVPAIQPSPNLKKHILNTIPKNKYALQPQSSTGLLGFLQRRPRLGFSLTFGIGVALGLILLSFLGRMPTVADSDLIGTMRAHDSSERLQTFGRADVAEDRFSANFELKRAGNLILTVMKLSAASPLQFALEFDDTDLRFSGFQRDDAAQNNLSMEEGRVVLLHRGENRYVLAFTDRTARSSALAFKVYGPELIYETTLVAGGEAH